MEGSPNCLQRILDARKDLEGEELERVLTQIANSEEELIKKGKESCIDARTAYMSLFWVYERHHKPGYAKQAFGRACELAGRAIVDVHLQRARSLWHNGKDEEALRVVESVFDKAGDTWPEAKDRLTSTYFRIKYG